MMKKIRCSTRKRKPIRNDIEKVSHELSSEEEEVKIPTTASRAKAKRGPLPMKLRALPQSFWQQPNTSGAVSPSSYCPPPEDDANVDRECHSEIVGVVNTELLFSLFHNVAYSQDVGAGKVPPAVRRGRPRKHKEAKTIVKMTKDDDPYFTSAIVPYIQVQEEEKVAQGRQVLAMISVSGETDNVTLSSTYSQRLSDLVINL